MKPFKILLAGLLYLLTFSPVSAQLQFEFEVRPRTEYRHGFKTLASPDQDPAFFTDQRTRFNGLFSDDNITVKISLQDVRVWGNQSQLVVGDGNLTSLHEGWAKFNISPKFAFKVGRQEIAYDDQRILGSVGWAQQARSHDAAILMFQDSTFSGHLGLAFNQNSPRLFSTDYTVKNYKALQYLWLHKDWKQANLSVLVLNNGVQVLNDNGEAVGTNFSHTLGGRFGFKLGKFQINSSAYYQGGKQANVQGTRINALYTGADLTYGVGRGHSFTLGGEILSGNNQMNPTGENNAFTPLYGTNHKFNGLMDYFYVGNHVNNVGLNDLFVKWGMKKSKFNSGIQLHFFTANEAIADEAGKEMSSYLGTEVDITTSFPVTKGVGVAAGYSHMFGSDSMVTLKNAGSTDATSNWVWMMVTIKPSFKIATK
ncbi:alginate export family protein [Flavilitoribacter nigricans]|uniref:Alginate export domain-containing protein n=1 Tax=Flavilitoribacter nigricans (strain ATCC 23147 / DSM 23189 / NBRC 102662 / NCIMB 1420 / SS-2) TaxID=1122177 RepID=A0A2D0NEM4_FLAN2|nr:alginate export family protein [Flavilitoribacter nigricans]PHN06925.1 hypothetical protein CRP01_08905 [Flavilitoribacter nigricans DSM 23189 = NBRC 102662]